MRAVGDYFSLQEVMLSMSGEKAGAIYQLLFFFHLSLIKIIGTTSASRFKVVMRKNLNLGVPQKSIYIFN